MAKNPKTAKTKSAGVDWKAACEDLGIQPLAPFTVRVDSAETLAYLAVKAHRYTERTGEVQNAAHVALSALATAQGRDGALWEYRITGGAKAPSGTRIFYAPLDRQANEERALVKDAQVRVESGVDVLDILQAIEEDV